MFEFVKKKFYKNRYFFEILVDFSYQMLYIAIIWRYVMRTNEDIEQIQRSMYEDTNYQLDNALRSLNYFNLPENFNPTFGMTLRIELIDPEMKYRIKSSKRIEDKVHYEFFVEPWNKEELFDHIDLKIKNQNSVSEDSLYIPHTIMYEDINENTAIIGILKKKEYHRYKINDIKNFIEYFGDVEKEDFDMYVEEIFDEPIKNKWIQDYLKHSKSIIIDKI